MLPQLFHFENTAVRIIVTPEGEPHFVASDVCSVLGLSNVSQALTRLDEDEKTDIILNDVTGRPQVQAVVTEPGLYTLVLRSRKPEAKPFKRWVTHDVLPQIRKTGKYEVQSAMPTTYLDALKQLVAKEEENLGLQLALIQAQPAVEFYDQVASSKDAIPMGEASRVLNIPGMGQNKLFDFLRTRKILMNGRNGTRRNMPYQTYIDRGYFRVVEQKYTTPDGETHINVKTLVLQKGLDYIRKQVESFSRPYLQK